MQYNNLNRLLVKIPITKSLTLSQLPFHNSYNLPLLNFWWYLFRISFQMTYLYLIKLTKKQQMIS